VTANNRVCNLITRMIGTGHLPGLSTDDNARARELSADRLAG
jgi:hypothetical protein